jgi:hypothetical protein
VGAAFHQAGRLEGVDEPGDVSWRAPQVFAQFTLGGRTAPEEPPNELGPGERQPTLRDSPCHGVAQQHRQLEELLDRNVELLRTGSIV